MGLTFLLELLSVLLRVGVGPCLLDRMLILETEKWKGREREQRQKDREPTKVPNHDCSRPAVYTISDRKGNEGGREGE